MSHERSKKWQTIAIIMIIISGIAVFSSLCMLSRIQTLTSENHSLDQENTRLVTRCANLAQTAKSDQNPKAKPDKSLKLLDAKHFAPFANASKRDLILSKLSSLDKELPVLPSNVVAINPTTSKVSKTQDQDLLSLAHTWLAECHRHDYRNAIALLGVANHYSPTKILKELGWKEVWKYVAIQALSNCRKGWKDSWGDFLRIAVYEKGVSLNLIEKNLTEEAIAEYVAPGQNDNFTDQTIQVEKPVTEEVAGDERDTQTPESIIVLPESQQVEVNDQVLIIDWRPKKEPFAVSSLFVEEPCDRPPD